METIRQHLTEADLQRLEALTPREQERVFTMLREAATPKLKALHAAMQED
jgi:hypothetical protein